LVPDDNGVLVPSDEGMGIGEVSANEHLLSLAANSGGSGAGMSHWAQASRCGRRARLSAERYQRFADEGRELPASKNHFIIGSVMHKLHELARKPDPSVVLDYNEQFKNPNVAEGTRLYKGWLRHHGLHFYGEPTAVEQHLSDENTFAPATVTAAIDMVVELDVAACSRLRSWGLEVPPGVTLVDWKSADSPSDGTNYKEGLQSLWYPYIWNLHNPDRPAQGIIFDVTMKRSRRKERAVLRDDFQKFFVPFGLESVESLRGMVMQGYRNVEDNIPNRSECTSFFGGTCPFKTNGECDAHM